MDANASLSAAQQDMRYGFLDGAPGVLASALAWLVASGFAFYQSPQAGVIALFIGGMLIHPAGMLGYKLLGRPGAQSKGNPLTSLALAAPSGCCFACRSPMPRSCSGPNGSSPPCC